MIDFPSNRMPTVRDCCIACEVVQYLIDMIDQRIGLIPPDELVKAWNNLALREREAAKQFVEWFLKTLEEGKSTAKQTTFMGCDCG